MVTFYKQNLLMSHLFPLHPALHLQLYVDEECGKHTPLRQLFSLQISVEKTKKYTTKCRTYTQYLD